MRHPLSSDQQPATDPDLPWSPLAPSWCSLRHQDGGDKDDQRDGLHLVAPEGNHGADKTDCKDGPLDVDGEERKHVGDHEHHCCAQGKGKGAVDTFGGIAVQHRAAAPAAGGASRVEEDFPLQQVAVVAGHECCGFVSHAENGSFNFNVQYSYRGKQSSIRLLNLYLI